MPSNRGLFQRVISQSGVVGRTNLLPKNMIQDLIKDLERRLYVRQMTYINLLTVLEKKRWKKSSILPTS
jgi:carboxylesterase type B